MLPMKMPWKGKNVPHGTLDIIRKCNIECEGCYNAHPGFLKSVDEVKRDLDHLLGFRKLDIVTLAGGEVTLHPELPAIVKHVRSMGIRAAIVTNGLLLDGELVSLLRDAGIDLILLHIQQDQRRSDLPASADLDDIEQLRDRKLSLIGESGIEAGICHIIYRNREEELERVMTQFCRSRWARFALMTMFSDFGRLGEVEGTIEGGFRQVVPGSLSREALEPDVQEVIQSFSDFGLEPFAYVGANGDESDQRWLVYFLISVFGKSGCVTHHGVSSSLLERLVMQLAKVLPTGSRFMSTPSRGALFSHLLLNSLTGGNLPRNLGVMSRLLAGRACSDKHILLQRAPQPSPNGQIVFCADCPDATVRDGELLPHCLVDRIRPPARREPEAGSTAP